eukprot:4035283-Pleurochrysis_carterae.AAC.1
MPGAGGERNCHRGRRRRGRRGAAADAEAGGHKVVDSRAAFWAASRTRHHTLDRPHHQACPRRTLQPAHCHSAS